VHTNLLQNELAVSHGRAMIIDSDLPDFDFYEADGRPSRFSGIGNAPTHTIDLQTLVDELSASVVLDFSNIRQTSFGKLLESIPIPVLLIDESCKIIFVNNAWQKVSLNYQIILGRPFSSIFTRRSVARAVNSVVEKAFMTRRPLVASTVLEVDESRIYGRVHFRSLKMGGDRALIVLVEDLTAEKKQLILTQKHKESLLKAHEELESRVEERTSALQSMNEDLLREIGFRKEAEHSLEASRASFTSIVEKTGEGILVISPESVVLYANPAASYLLGQPREKLISEQLGLTVFPGQITEINRNRENGEACILEIRVHSTDWNEKPARLLMLRDITERKMVEKEMLKAEKLESLELVAGGIAHDFNNLLTGTIANISLAKMHVTRGTTLYDALRNAEKAATGAKHLTQQLLTFTKGGDPVKRPASMSLLLKDSITLALSGSSIKNEVSIPDDLWPAEIDQQQMGQVFQNLLINSLQAMPDGGTLTVCAENLFPGLGHRLLLKEGRYVKIAIKDTGCGIPPEHVTKVFDPYFTTKPKGSGIGLATAYSVVKRHGGVIDVESEVDVGTSVFVYLPASSEHEIDNPIDDSIETPAFGTGKVLLMDDEEAIRVVAGDLLTLLGYEVEMAKDGSECIERYKAAMESGQPFSVVIMDLTVPGGMGGKVAVQKLLEIDPKIKAIVSSGYSMDPIMFSYKHYGFKGIVPKPYNAVELSKALHELTTENRD
jgi:two-component system, cell cycle sensor histidine kinase and response regulator CckA